MKALPADLQADCMACAALCCVAPAFDSLQGFGHDKPANTPCHNLDADCRCKVHANLAAAGYPGCVRFDCYGAGQRALREFAAGVDWRRDVTRAAALFATFDRLRDLHQLKALVHYTRGRVSAAHEHAALTDTLEQIESLCRRADDEAIRMPARALRASTVTQLRGLLPDSPPPNTLAR